MIRAYAFFLLILSSLCLVRCKDKDPKEPIGENFDKGAMLQNLADNIIVPNYQSAVTAAENLEDKWELFSSDPSETSYSELLTSFDILYLAWQSISPVEIGPASGVSLKWLLNTYPADTARIQQMILNGNTEFTSAQNSAAKALPALDYVLYTYSTSQLSSSATQSYIEANISLIKVELSSVLDDWQSTYRDEFVSSTGSDVGSSLGQLVNAINQDYELIKNAKVGIPLGKKTLGLIQPHKVEGRYSAASLALIKANVESILTLFKGGDGLGLDDLLNSLDARYGNQLLSDAILSGFEDVLDAHAAITGNLEDAIENDASSVDVLHTNLQNLVVLLKTDMPSRIGVQITYQDNDGD